MTTAQRSRTYRDAICSALADEMRSDPAVLLLGEDVGAAGGVFKATGGLLEEFGPVRVRDTPISEQAIIGGAMGAAMLGWKPVAEIMFADFAGVCFDQIANQLAKHSFLTGMQVSMPVTIRLANGAGLGFGAQHSQAVENWFIGEPGLKICVPSFAEDAYTLLRQAVQDPGPVLFFEHKGLYAKRDDQDVPAPTGPHGAAVVRPGTDLTIVATQAALHSVLEARPELDRLGIDAEIIDLRWLRPLDMDTVLKSVVKTSRLLCVQEGEAMGGWGEHVVTETARSGFNYLDAPPTLLASPPVPLPYAGNLEKLWMPSAEKVVSAAQALMHR